MPNEKKKRLAEWDLDDVSRWLSQIGLNNHAERLRKIGTTGLILSTAKSTSDDFIRLTLGFEDQFEVIKVSEHLKKIKSQEKAYLVSEAQAKIAMPDLNTISLDVNNEVLKKHMTVMKETLTGHKTAITKHVTALAEEAKMNRRRMESSQAAVVEANEKLVEATENVMDVQVQLNVTTKEMHERVSELEKDKNHIDYTLKDLSLKQEKLTVTMEDMEASLQEMMPTDSGLSEAEAKRWSDQFDAIKSELEDKPDHTKLLSLQHSIEEVDQKLQKGMTQKLAALEDTVGLLKKQNATLVDGLEEARVGQEVLTRQLAEQIERNEKLTQMLMDQAEMTNTLQETLSVHQHMLEDSTNRSRRSSRRSSPERPVRPVAEPVEEDPPLHIDQESLTQLEEDFNDLQHYVQDNFHLWGEEFDNKLDKTIDKFVEHQRAEADRISRKLYVLTEILISKFGKEEVKDMLKQVDQDLVASGRPKTPVVDDLLAQLDLTEEDIPNISAKSIPNSWAPDKFNTEELKQPSTPSETTVGTRTPSPIKSPSKIGGRRASVPPPASHQEVEEMMSLIGHKVDKEELESRLRDVVSDLTQRVALLQQDVPGLIKSELAKTTHTRDILAETAERLKHVEHTDQPINRRVERVGPKILRSPGPDGSLGQSVLAQASLGADFPLDQATNPSRGLTPRRNIRMPGAAANKYKKFMQTGNRGGGQNFLSALGSGPKQQKVAQNEPFLGAQEQTGGPVMNPRKKKMAGQLASSSEETAKFLQKHAKWKEQHDEKKKRDLQNEQFRREVEQNMKKQGNLMNTMSRKNYNEKEYKKQMAAIDQQWGDVAKTLAGSPTTAVKKDVMQKANKTGEKIIASRAPALADDYSMFDKRK
eukprot:GFYU01007432.1.p1 GENE.GFYU01007432.1~~GFYU01007432.1.p1  ORF type:complete len:871 (+),score=309.49 GFYU01007432.1:261-2873(+)